MGVADDVNSPHFRFEEYNISFKKVLFLTQKTNFLFEKSRFWSQDYNIFFGHETVSLNQKIYSLKNFKQRNSWLKNLFLIYPQNYCFISVETVFTIEGSNKFFDIHKKYLTQIQFVQKLKIHMESKRPSSWKSVNPNCRPNHQGVTNNS